MEEVDTQIGVTEKENDYLTDVKFHFNRALASIYAAD